MQKVSKLRGKIAAWMHRQRHGHRSINGHRQMHGHRDRCMGAQIDAWTWVDEWTQVGAWTQVDEWIYMQIFCMDIDNMLGHIHVDKSMEIDRLT